MKKYKCKKRGKDKKSNKKKTCNSNPFTEDAIPPCAKYLDNKNIFSLDRECFYRNDNKVFSVVATRLPNNNPPNIGDIRIDTSIEVSITTFIIGLFINKIQMGIIEYDPTKPIHSNKEIDAKIHELLGNPPENCETCANELNNLKDEKNEKLKENKGSKNNDSKKYTVNQSYNNTQLIYALRIFISSGTAADYILKKQINISPLNYYILSIINNMEGNPELYFAKNNYTFPIPINFYFQD
ncbi:hypothetical protein [Clostridium beijerinckii]|uniref:hypothetical protein n=1 Tax=Clostridium beijerinckii TaxID=1520 RepID=UPI0009CE5199|nr:hypothetical protein [Clostridium beijerinckii]MBA8934566.1 hypothetical protein [Clostridium beijerinckii]NRU38752.1 hypothetical protein [Clostridium beijerinckii]NSA97969.1 hypothetical protein [Clostridium beijerinckii]OOM57664.1 hypothetical protein CLOBI_40430 [Clostridium beijerinckii]OOM73127.1 hypothetical protein CLBEIC_03790 [Clostridium beijerinckii]